MNNYDEFEMLNIMDSELKCDIAIFDVAGNEESNFQIATTVRNHNNAKTLEKAYNKAKALEVEHKALKKDVARYFELFMNRKRTIHESTEILDLFVKLSKVGKEE